MAPKKRTATPKKRAVAPLEPKGSILLDLKRPVTPAVDEDGDGNGNASSVATPPWRQPKAIRLLDAREAEDIASRDALFISTVVQALVALFKGNFSLITERTCHAVRGLLVSKPSVPVVCIDLSVFTVNGLTHTRCPKCWQQGLCKDKGIISVYHGTDTSGVNGIIQSRGILHPAVHTADHCDGIYHSTELSKAFEYSKPIAVGENQTINVVFELRTLCANRVKSWSYTKIGCFKYQTVRMWVIVSKFVNEKFIKTEDLDLLARVASFR